VHAAHAAQGVTILAPHAELLPDVDDMPSLIAVEFLNNASHGAINAHYRIQIRKSTPFL
jgi:hypothetical protein